MPPEVAVTAAVTMLISGVALAVWPSVPRGMRAGLSPLALLRRMPLPGPRGRRSRAPVLVGVGVGLAVVAVASWAVAIAAAVAGATAARLVQRARAAARRRRDLTDLAAAIHRLARDLRSGTPPAAAAAHGLAEAPERVRSVLAGVAAAGIPGTLGVPGAAGVPGTPVGLGRPGGAAAGAVAGDFAEVAARLDAAWDLALRHGVPLAAAVATIADDLADRSRLADARAAQVAGPAVSGYVLAGLPVAGLLLGSGMGAHPVAVLTGSAIGSVLLVVGTLLCCGGLLWAEKIVRG